MRKNFVYRNRPRRWLHRAAVASICTLSCAPAAGADVLVFAAASTAGALDTLVADYAETTGDAVRVSYASSGALARQIDDGAPAGLFLSANTAWIDWLDKHRRLSKYDLKHPSRTILFGNRLVLIAPNSIVRPLIQRDITAELIRLRGRLAIADPDHVPAGAYAKAALTSLGLWEKFSARTARAKDVRGALRLVERRETALGIVYETDARHSALVAVLNSFPETTYPSIQYVLAITRDHDTQDARRLYDFLTTPKALGYFVRYGFTRP